MGNNNSTHENKVDTVATTKKDNEQTKQYYTKNANTSMNKNNRNIYDDANKMYDQIWDNDSDVYIEKNVRVEVYADPSRGISMPYISDRNTYNSDNINDMLTTSENPRYIEFIVCKGNLSDLNEKYAIHKSTPNHDCRGDCNCINQMIEVVGNKSRIYRQPQSHIHEQSSPVLSPTSIDACDITTDNQTIAATRAKSANNMNNPTCKPMFGGQTNNEDIYSETSPEEITDSDEQTNDVFSTTTEMSDTSTSPGPNNKQKSKKNSLFTTSDEDEGDSDDDDLDTDDSDIIQEETDVDDEDLEGLDEEDITEDGFILEQSDISSNDLYAMQSRVFNSNTETPVRKTKKAVRKTKKTIRKKKSNDADDDETTELVRRAIHQANLRHNKNNRTSRNSRNSRNNGGLFDSEDMKIFDMNSSTDKYMKRPVNRSIKYN